MRFVLLLSVILSSGLVGCEQKSTPPPSPSATLILTVKSSASPTRPPAVTLTPSPTATFTSVPSASPTPSRTPTLATPIIEVTAVMPGVVMADSAIKNEPIYLDPIEPLPNATLSQPPYTGWFRFESDHPTLDYTGTWEALPSAEASQGQYHYSVDPQAQVNVVFAGRAVRVHFVAFTNGGHWTLWLDGRQMTELDNYAPQAVFGQTEIFELADDGPHQLSLRASASTNPASTGHMIALDALDIYQPAPVPITSITPTRTRQPVQIEILQEAPSLVPTLSPAPPQQVQVAVVIAYDENANRTVDPAEGVQGIPVHLVEIGTNRVLTQSQTDDAGYAALQTSTEQGVRLVVPYFGAYWDMRTRADLQTFTLLLPAGHQPGLLP